MVNAGRGVRPATVRRSILFTALLATEAFVREIDAATQTPKTY